MSVTPESPAEDYDDGGEEDYEEYPDPNTNNYQPTKWKTGNSIICIVMTSTYILLIFPRINKIYIILVD